MEEGTGRGVESLEPPSKDLLKKCQYNIITREYATDWGVVWSFDQWLAGHVVETGHLGLIIARVVDSTRLEVNPTI